MMAKLLWITSILLCASLESHLLNAQTLRLPSEKPKPLNSEYYRPLIGIVSHPGDGANGKLSRAANVSYIAASYVKFVESGGARVVPLIYNERPEILEQKFRAVNGLIFTGGSAKYGPYHQTIKKLFQFAETFFEKFGDRVKNWMTFNKPHTFTFQGYDVGLQALGRHTILLHNFCIVGNSATEPYIVGRHVLHSYAKTMDLYRSKYERAIEENDNGEYFPVYAVCLGFEILSMIISQDLDILENFDAVNSPSTLIFENEAAKNSSIFKWFPSDILSKMSSEPIFMQNHKFGVSPERMSANDGLSSFFKILTTSYDKNNKTYVSTVQAYKYPVTALQWHPEKNTFEWEITTIPHSPDAIQVTQSVANFVVSESRKSNHKPSFKQEEEYLIYNYSPAYSGKVGGSFDQVYLFT